MFKPLEVNQDQKIETGLSRPIKNHGKTKGLMEKGLPYSTIRDISCVAIINIWGDKAISLLFLFLRNEKWKSAQINNIHPSSKIKVSMGQQCPSYTK